MHLHENPKRVAGHCSPAIVRGRERTGMSARECVLMGLADRGLACYN